MRILVGVLATIGMASGLALVLAGCTRDQVHGADPANIESVREVPKDDGSGASIRVIKYKDGSMSLEDVDK